jgi:tetratricopeptide (TPR) repeat protein
MQPKLADEVDMSETGTEALLSSVDKSPVCGLWDGSPSPVALFPGQRAAGEGAQLYPRRTLGSFLPLLRRFTYDTNLHYTALVLFLGVSAAGMAAQVSSSQAERLRHIQMLVERGNLAEAEQRLTESLKEFPREAPFYDLRGVVEAQRGNYTEAERDFLRAMELDPLLTGAYLNLGHLYQQNAGSDHDALENALRVYGKLLKIDPASAEANYQSAVLLEYRKAFRLSLDHLARLPAADQEKAQTLAVRCADLVGLERPGEASAAADRLLASIGLAEADVDLIVPLLEGNHWSDLEQRLLAGASQRGVAGTQLLETLGRLYLQEGKLGAARATLEKAAESGVPSAATLLELARIADKQNDYKGALGYLAHARDLEPQNAAIHFFFGMASMKENLLEEAFRSLKQAVALAPQNPYYNYALGAVAQQRADADEAVACFKKYCALRPRDPQGRLQLGITYFKIHQEDAAERELASAVRQHDTAAVAHFFLARIANQRGDYSKAFQELHEALATRPEYADAYAEEGIIYLKQRNYAAAEKALTRALAIDPDHYVANLNLMSLYQRTGDQRAAKQARRFEEIKKKRSEEAKLALRSIEIVH